MTSMHGLASGWQRNTWLYSMEISLWGSSFLISAQLLHYGFEGAPQQGWLARSFQGWSAQCILPISTQAAWRQGIQTLNSIEINAIGSRRHVE